MSVVVQGSIVAAVLARGRRFDQFSEDVDAIGVVEWEQVAGFLEWKKTHLPL